MRKALLIPLVILVLLLSSSECPAPFIYTPGEGWNWQRDTAREQIDVAKAGYDEGDYKIAVKAAGRVIREWPFSDYAPEAQYVTALAYQGNHRDEKAFKAYQSLITRYPKYEKYDQVLKQQFEITNKFLEGQRFRLWGLFPVFRSMDRTTEMYKELIQNGPFSEIAPQAQLNIGTARENKKDFAGAVVAYETAADKYSDLEGIAEDALFRAGEALQKEAKEAEYDQSVASRAIEVFNDFMALHPTDDRVDQADTYIRELRVEQARGSLQIARYYDKKHIDRGALTYYNDVVDIFSRLLNDTDHEYAVEARERIAQLKVQVIEAEAPSE
jgi:outer membrane protein assembly factor BamD (BamD/ComL family)